MEFGQGTASVDKRGHGEHSRLQMPAALLRATEELAASPRWPFYRTKQDVMRDGIFRLIEEIADADPTMNEVWVMARVENEMEWRTRRQEFLSGIVEKFGQQFSYCSDADEVKQVVEELTAVLGMTLPESIRDRLERMRGVWSNG